MRYIANYQGVMAHLFYILIYKGFTFIYFQLFLKIKKENIFYSSQNCKLRKCETWLL